MSDPDGVAGEILDQVQSHVMSLGHFDRVNAHELLARPGAGLAAAVWLRRIDPLPEASGLAVTSVRQIIMVRCYASADQEPRDDIDPALVAAVWALIRVLVADLRLGATAGREIDVLGTHGVGLSAQDGYLEWPDDAGMSRIYDVTVPVVVYDVWPQEEAAA